MFLTTFAFNQEIIYGRLLSVGMLAQLGSRLAFLAYPSKPLLSLSQLGGIGNTWIHQDMCDRMCFMSFTLTEFEFVTFLYNFSILFYIYLIFITVHFFLDIFSIFIFRFTFWHFPDFPFSSTLSFDLSSSVIVSVILSKHEYSSTPGVIWPYNSISVLEPDRVCLLVSFFVWIVSESIFNFTFIGHLTSHIDFRHLCVSVRLVQRTYNQEV